MQHKKEQPITTLKNIQYEPIANINPNMFYMTFDPKRAFNNERFQDFFDNGITLLHTKTTLSPESKKDIIVNSLNKTTLPDKDLLAFLTANQEKWPKDPVAIAAILEKIPLKTLLDEPICLDRLKDTDATFRETLLEYIFEKHPSEIGNNAFTQVFRKLSQTNPKAGETTIDILESQLEKTVNEPWVKSFYEYPQFFTAGNYKDFLSKNLYNYPNNFKEHIFENTSIEQFANHLDAKDFSKLSEDQLIKILEKSKNSLHLDTIIKKIDENTLNAFLMKKASTELRINLLRSDCFIEKFPKLCTKIINADETSTFLSNIPIKRRNEYKKQIMTAIANLKDISALDFKKMDTLLGNQRFSKDLMKKHPTFYFKLLIMNDPHLLEGERKKGLKIMKEIYKTDNIFQNNIQNAYTTLCTQTTDFGCATSLAKKIQKDHHSPQGTK